MILLQNWLEHLQADDSEVRQMVSGVSWAGYEALLDELGDDLNYRVTYLDGVLELVSPSCRHERNRMIISSLLQTYCFEKRIPYFPLGSTTFCKEEKRVATEPDGSFCIGSNKEFPDLVIEVVEISGGVSKLEVYQRLGVGEIWFFQAERFEVYCLRDAHYEQVSQSEILPNLALNLLAQFVVSPNPLKAALALREDWGVPTAKLKKPSGSRFWMEPMNP